MGGEGRGGEERRWVGRGGGEERGVGCKLSVTAATHAMEGMEVQRRAHTRELHFRANHFNEKLLQID